uniref:DNA repair protein RecO n=1 Tax=candidate division WOR-3 bacterium TaxID=2052148 RepID=A0A7C4YRL7_UNCW3
MLHKDEGIILRNISFKNTSIVTHIYTKKSGNLSFVIKGYKKSKLSGSIESGYLVSFVYYKREYQDMGIIKEANIISPFFQLRKNSDKLKILFSILYILEHSPKSLPLWNITLKTLNFIENKDNIYVFAYFLLYFYYIEGIFPVIEKCSVCGKKDIRYFSITKNGTVCNEHKSEEDIEINEWFNVFLKIYSGKISDIKESSYNFLIDVLIKYGEFHLGDWVSHLRNILPSIISQ